MLLAQAFLVWRYRDLLLNPGGPVPWAISDKWLDPWLPTLSSLVPLFAKAGLQESAVGPVVLGLHSLAAAFMTIGYRTRFSVVVTWATFVLLRNSSIPWMYGLGVMALIGLFYCLFAPIGRAWSVDHALRRERGDLPAAPYVAMFRLHLCIIYAASGFAKAMGEQWWTGEALWRALLLPQFRQFDPSILLAWPPALQAAAIAALVSQLAYPVLVWTRWRAPIVVFTELLHLGIAIFLGMWLFSLVMIALNTAAFGQSVWAAVLRRSRVRAAPPPPRDLAIIYDGACPFCDDYVRYQRLREVASVQLIDARQRREALAEYAIQPRELEDGMVVVADGRRYRGADAMHLLSTLSEPPRNWWVSAVAAISRTQFLARLAYPVLKLGRRIALAFLRVPRFPRD